MNRAWWFKFSVWLAAFYTGLLILSLTLGQYYGQLLLPYYRTSLALINSNYQLTDLSLVTRQGQTHIAANFQQKRARMIQGTLLPAGREFNSSSLLGHALQHPILILSPLLAWWVLIRRKPWRLLLGGVLILLGVEFLDIPFVLLGSIEDLVLVNVDPSLPARSGLVTWMHFLNGGGRIGLCLFAVVMVLYPHYRHIKK